ncbi:MAG TPA: hypothetical protein VFY13_09765, partial [Luteolibacter sp.]|nr:hypothetical protein [Luteolibacter sp.]
MVARMLKSFTRVITGCPRRRSARNSGFALVVTVSLLVLLTVIAIGFLSLSAVSTRSSGAAAAEAVARANARMALMLAIGELQLHAGPDTRVTASASILDGASASASDELAVTGVWKSWEGSDHTTTGAAAARPIAPDYVSKRQPASSSAGRFLSWLVSMPQQMDQSNLISDAPGWTVAEALQDIVRNTPSAGFVPLVSSGSLAPGDPREIHVKPVEIANSARQPGAYAWWVGGENQKARLPVPHKPADNDNAAAWSMQAKSHSIADPSALDLDELLAPNGPAQAAKAMTLKTSSLLKNPIVPNPPDPAKQFHDLSATSVGLLT